MKIYEDISFIDFNSLIKAKDLIQDRQLNNYEEDKSYIQLQSSIFQDGILTPLILARHEDDSLELISGRRRLSIIVKSPERFRQIPVQIIKKEHLKDRYTIAYKDNTFRKNLSNLTQYESLIVDLTIDKIGLEKYEQRSMKARYLSQYSLIEDLKCIRKYLNLVGKKNAIPLENKYIPYLKKIQQFAQILQLNENKLINYLIDSSFTPSEKILIDIGFDIKQLMKYRKNKKFKTAFQDFEILAYNIELKNRRQMDIYLNILNKYNKTLQDYFEINDDDVSTYFIDDNTGAVRKELTKKYIEIFTQDKKENILKDLGSVLSAICEELEYEKEHSVDIKKELKTKFLKLINSDSQSTIEKISLFLKEFDDN